MSIRLYDKTFTDSLPPFLSSGPNAGVVALCRRGEAAFKRLRSSVEGWYSCLSQEVRDTLEPRLRSLDNELFTPTLFEIALAGYFLSRGLKFDYEPEINGKTPDFLVNIGGNPYIFEVATIFDSAAFQSQTTHVRELEKWLNKQIQSDYWIIIEYHCWPPKNIDRQAIKRELESLISGTTSDTATHRISGILDATVVLSKASGGCCAGRIGGSGTPIVEGDATTRLSETLSEKAKKYNKLNTPMVIVVCDPGNFTNLDDIDVQQAIYGTQAYICNPTSPSLILARKRDGLFSKLGQDKLPRRRYVSGVLVMDRDYTDTEFWFPLRFYGNPYADTPLPASAFPGVPRFIPASDGSGKIEMIWHDKNALPFRLW